MALLLRRDLDQLKIVQEEQILRARCLRRKRYRYHFALFTLFKLVDNHLSLILTEHHVTPPKSVVIRHNL